MTEQTTTTTKAPAKGAKTAPRAKAEPRTKTATGAKAARAAAKPRAARTEAGARAAGGDHGAVPLTAEERIRMIAERAYLRAERRGFQGGDSVEDWLAAEAEVDGLGRHPAG